MRRRALPFVFLVLATGLHFFSPPVADNDLWGHVFFGRELLAEGALPETNRFAYTAPDYPWINHEIGAEVAMALAWEALGSPGLLILKLALGLLTLLVMVETASHRARAPAAWAAALALAAALMADGYLVRPQLFTFLGLAILWDRIHAHDRGDGGRMFVVAPLLVAAWVNFHGGVLVGAGVLLFYAALALPRADRPERLRLAATAALSVLALLANPYGFELPRFLVLDVLRERNITEWAPVALLGPERPLFKLTIAACLAALLVVPRRRPWEVATVAVAAVVAFRHVRHLPLFAILAAPLLAEGLGAVLERARRAAPALAALRAPAAVVAVLLGALEIAGVSALYRRNHGQILLSPESYPVDAVRFLRDNGFHGNLALPFDWGEYAIWHLYPRCRVSIDGRYTTAYPDQVIADAEAFWYGAPGTEAILRDATIVLASRKQPLWRRLFEDPDWRYVHSDATALVFVRQGTPVPEPLRRRERREAEGAFFFP